MEREQSQQWYDRAVAVIAGGVNSPARSFQGVGGNPPVVMERGEGAYLYDVDGHRYIDYLAAFGPLVLGHAHPAVVEAGRQGLAEGSLTGAPHPDEIQLAEELCRAIVGLESVRLTTTGTEAVMSAYFRAPEETAAQRPVDSRGDLYVGEVSWTNWPQTYPDTPRPDDLRSLHKFRRVAG